MFCKFFLPKKLCIVRMLLIWLYRFCNDTVLCNYKIGAKGSCDTNLGGEEAGGYTDLCIDKIGSNSLYDMKLCWERISE